MVNNNYSLNYESSKCRHSRGSVRGPGPIMTEESHSCSINEILRYAQYDKKTMFNDQLGMYKVVTSFNWTGLKQWYNQNTSGRLVLSSDTGKGVYPFYSGDTDNLMIWLLRNTWAYSTATTNYESALVPLQTVMTVTGFNSGYLYQLTWYNPWTGDNLGTSTFTGPSITATAPQYVRDIIAIIRPEESD
jgi:hypothetical protein